MRNQLTFAAALLAAIAIPVGAQQPGPPGTRIAGKVKSVTASQLTLVTAKGDIDIAVTPKTRVMARQAASISDIKPGTYLGTANQDSTTASNAGTATEVHLAANGPNVNSPMNNTGLTMTNGHVKSITSAAGGEELTVDYGQSATRHVLVPRDTVVTKMKEESMAVLKPGMQVNAMTSPGADGKPAANFIMVGPAPATSRP